MQTNENNDRLIEILEIWGGQTPVVQTVPSNLFPAPALIIWHN
jgi:hypothetical protein